MPVTEAKSSSEASSSLRGTYWLTRVLFLRAICAVYAVAFAVAVNQNRELIGDRGLTPLATVMQATAARTGSSMWSRITSLPTLLWLWEPWDRVDLALDGLAVAGLIISTWVVISGAANMLAMAALWILYHSIVNVGQNWYSFGWESQLLETGFLCIWLVPLLEWRAFPSSLAPPSLNVVAFRWLVVRIMLGAGLIKIRGDKCWKDLTCMHYFYETQPNPNPVAYFAHHAPDLWHRVETMGNHLVELGFPALVVLLPLSRTVGMANGAAQILFQVAIIATGNLSFLNWLTAVPSVWFFDDACWASLFSSRSLEARANAIRQNESRQGALRQPRIYVHLLIGTLLASLSWPVVLNLFSTRQVMNTSFEPFRLVNTYGAFGSVTKQRSEVIFEGTLSDDPTLKSAAWMEYEFKCKPGAPSRRPCLISPYHYRLDWLMWFAAFQDLSYNPWLIHLAGKMLDNDPMVDSLLEANPFRGKRPPKHVRASLYRYTFTTPGSSDWWNRSYSGPYMPAVNKNDLKEIYKKFGWRN